MASKFDYSKFVWDYDDEWLAFNANNYSEKQAEAIAKTELENPIRTHEYGYVYYGFGTNEDGERVNGYWLCDFHPKNGIPVIVFKEGRGF